MSKDNNSERKFYCPIRLSSRFVVVMQLALSARDYENCVTNDKNSLKCSESNFHHRDLQNSTATRSVPLESQVQRQCAQSQFYFRNATSVAIDGLRVNSKVLSVLAEY